MTDTGGSGANALEGPGRGDWPAARDFLRAHPTKWTSLSWIAARTLIESVNDQLARGAGTLVTDLREHWVATASPERDLQVSLPEATRFVVAGDSGEQDGSQYVVAPALGRASEGADFVLLLSDVIYPSGDVNDYVDGYYKPYHSEPPFQLAAPVFAIPGNHDWYDGLHGFAYHFLGDDGAFDPSLFTPTFGAQQFLRRAWDRFCRTMLRPPSLVQGRTAELRDALGAEPQPGPYFVLETKHVRLVCIDTGIDGTVDRAQLDWLEQIGNEKPKLLMTGKPLLVNGELKPCPVTGEKTDDDGDSVWKVVTRPGSGFVATIGGDTHNFQLYTKPGELTHLVSGGAGAFTQATHTIRMSSQDDRITTVQPPDPGLFPGTAESLAYFAQQLVPSVWRMLRAGIAMTLAMAFMALVVLDVLEQPSRDTAGWVAAGLLGLPLLGRSCMRTRPGSGHRVRRALIIIEAVGLGGLSVWLAHHLAGAAFEPVLWLTAGAAGWVVVTAWGLRVSRWWDPARLVGLRAGRHLLFTLTTLAAAAALVLAGSRLEAWATALASAVVFLAAAWGAPEWMRRGGEPRATFWHQWSVLVATVTQLVMLWVWSGWLAHREGFPGAFWGGLLGGVLLLLAVAAATVALPLAGDRWQGSWPRVARRLRWGVLLLPAVLLAGWAALAQWLDEAWMQAAFALPALVYLVAGSLLAVDALRRRSHGSSYKWQVGFALLLVAAGLWWSGWYDAWPVDAVLAAALVLVVTATIVLLAHLVFIGAPWLLLDWPARWSPSYQEPRDVDDLPFWRFLSREEATEIIRAAGVPEKPNVGWRTRRRADIAFPGLTPPFGPIQKFVSEIYSFDEPPFFKHFLVVTTTEEQVDIEVHRVRGDLPVEVVRLPPIRLPGATG